MKNSDLIKLLSKFDEDCDVQCEYHNEDSNLKLEDWDLAIIDDVEMDTCDTHVIKRLLIKIS